MQICLLPCQSPNTAKWVFQAKVLNCIQLTISKYLHILTIDRIIMQNNLGKVEKTDHSCTLNVGKINCTKKNKVRRCLFIKDMGFKVKCQSTYIKNVTLLQKKTNHSTGLPKD